MDIRILKREEIVLFKALIRVFEKEFEMENFQIPDQEDLLKTLKNKNFKVFVAIEDGQVMGGITLYILPPYYSNKSQAYIYDLAVLSSHQRKGIGTRLMEVVLAYGRNLGYEEIFVQADKMDDHALAFYRSIPRVLEEDVIHFSYPL